MKLLNTCYGDYSLQTGTIIIGMLDLSALLVSFWFVTADSVDSESEVINNSISKNSKLLACFYFIIITTVLLLLLGAFKGNMWLMIPWMGSKMSIAISLPVLLIYFLIELNNYPRMCLGAIGVIVIVILIAMALLMYSLLVVVSYFDALRREKAKIEMEDQKMPLPEKMTGAGLYVHA